MIHRKLLTAKSKSELQMGKWKVTKSPLNIVPPIDYLPPRTLPWGQVQKFTILTVKKTFLSALGCIPMQSAGLSLLEQSEIYL